MNKVTIGTVIAGLGLVGAGYAYDVDIRGEQHEIIASNAHVSSVELNLQIVQAELKMYRSIQERRELSSDELARVEFLKTKLLILLAEQAKQVA